MVPYCEVVLRIPRMYQKKIFNSKDAWGVPYESDHTRGIITKETVPKPGKLPAKIYFPLRENINKEAQTHTCTFIHAVIFLGAVVSLFCWEKINTKPTLQQNLLAYAIFIYFQCTSKY